MNYFVMQNGSIEGRVLADDKHAAAVRFAQENTVQNGCFISPKISIFPISPTDQTGILARWDVNKTVDPRNPFSMAKLNVHGDKYTVTLQPAWGQIDESFSFNILNETEIDPKMIPEWLEI
jgi:hypothetical protein